MLSIKNNKILSDNKEICKNYFSDEIPSYFYYDYFDNYGIKFLEKEENNKFILRLSSKGLNTLALTYKINNKIYHTRIYKINDEWFGSLENKTGELDEYNDKSLENLIDKMMFKNGFIC